MCMNSSHIGRHGFMYSRHEIEKRRRTLACARPSTAKPEAVPRLDVETQIMDLSPVARDLSKQFQAVAAAESPDAKVVGEPGSESRPEPEFVCDATDAKTAVCSDAAKGDLFHLSDPGLSRKAQFEAKAALQKDPEEEEEDEEEKPPKGKNGKKGPGRPKGKAKPKGRAKAKGKAAKAKPSVSDPKEKPIPEDAPAETGEVPSLGAEQSAPEAEAGS